MSGQAHLLTSQNFTLMKWAWYPSHLQPFSQVRHILVRWQNWFGSASFYCNTDNSCSCSTAYHCGCLFVGHFLWKSKLNPDEFFVLKRKILLIREAMKEERTPSGMMMMLWFMRVLYLDTFSCYVETLKGRRCLFLSWTLCCLDKGRSWMPRSRPASEKEHPALYCIWRKDLSLNTVISCCLSLSFILPDTEILQYLWSKGQTQNTSVPGTAALQVDCWEMMCCRAVASQSYS